jgi:hypothetical protein
MKTLIVYYSYTGNNRLLSEHLARLLGSDICPVVELKKRNGFKILLDVFLKRTAKIKLLDLPIHPYEHVFFIAPLWASRIASPMRALLEREKNSIGSYSFISFCGYEIPGQKEKVTQELIHLTGKTPSQVLELKISDLFPPDEKNKIRVISKYQAKPQDLAMYSEQIHQIVATKRSETHEKLHPLV